MSVVTATATTTAETTDIQLSRIWQPLKLGNRTLKNRLIVPARTLNMANKDCVISDRHLGIYRELAANGAAMIITEQHAAHPVAVGSFYNPCSAYDRASVPQFEKFAQIAEEHNVLGAVQLFGSGVNDRGTMVIDRWHELWGVSDMPSPVHVESVMVMEKHHIQELIAGFARSAQNVKSGGLHGIELHAAHGYLLAQFLSASYNNRTDEYGGSVRNRCRVVIEIGQAVREVIGSDLVLGVRVSWDEFMGPAGIQPDEAAEQVEIFASSGLFDYISVSGGAYHTLHVAVPPMGTQDEAFMVPFAQEAKQIVGDRSAIFTVGRIRSLYQAEQILEAGAADAVAMGRQLLADPHTIRKTREGREREIIRCFGLNECIGRLFDYQEVICAMNPVTAREGRWGGGLKPAEKVKDVVVVGGGPSGMKVAAVAAQRGHRVRLYERDDELGGHLKLLRRFPGRQEWDIAIDNLKRAVENAGVEVHTGKEVTAAELEGLGCDALILATGCHTDLKGMSTFRPGRWEIPGVETGNVIDIRTAAARVLEDPTALGKKVIIYDESKTFVPFSVAELAGKAGAEVEIVSPLMYVGEHVQRRLEMGYLAPRLADAGVVLTAQHSIDGINGSEVTITKAWGGGEARIERDVDTIVFATYRIPNLELYKAIDQSKFAEVHRIGDCLAPREFSALIYDGEKIGRAL